MLTMSGPNAQVHINYARDCHLAPSAVELGRTTFLRVVRSHEVQLQIQIQMNFIGRARGFSGHNFDVRRQINSPKSGQNDNCGRTNLKLKLEQRQ